MEENWFRYFDEEEEPREPLQFKWGLVRQCSACNHTKTADRFVAGSGRCTACRAEIKLRHETTEMGRMCRLVRTAKTHAATRGKRKCREDNSGELSISAPQLLEMYHAQHGLCAVTKTPLSLESYKKTTVSLDRLDDTRGYHIDNCQLVCTAMNSARKFEQRDILCFPLVQRYTLAREAAAVARYRQSRFKSSPRYRV